MAKSERKRDKSNADQVDAPETYLSRVVLFTAFGRQWKVGSCFALTVVGSIVIGLVGVYLYGTYTLQMSGWPVALNALNEPAAAMTPADTPSPAGTTTPVPLQFVESSASPIIPAATLPPSETPTPSLTPSPTETPTPRPTYPSNWVCYQSKGADGFEFMHPSNWVLNSEQGSSAQFFTLPDRTAFFEVSPISLGELNSISMDNIESTAKKDVFLKGPYTVFRGGTKGYWENGPAGFYTEFVWDSSSGGSYARVLVLYLLRSEAFASLRKNESLMVAYMRANAASFTAAEMDTLHAAVASLGACP